MKAEISKTGLILRPENKEDQIVLDTLESKGFKKIEFEDTWDNTGGLKLIYNETWTHELK